MMADPLLPGKEKVLPRMIASSEPKILSTVGLAIGSRMPLERLS